jgi:hypothetical protein
LEWIGKWLGDGPCPDPYTQDGAAGEIKGDIDNVGVRSERKISSSCGKSGVFARWLKEGECAVSA